MNELIEQIATNAADYAVGKYGQHLPKGRQLNLWRRYYDSALSSLITFDELNRARSVMVRAFISEN